ncbi:MAG: beta-N-acetylhexosaminidase [Candidatus Omnitrophica bacterium]|nr:beta-N-acetylhexosaminidase [Candidatus Omnitrophota bacterium]
MVRAYKKTRVFLALAIIVTIVSCFSRVMRGGTENQPPLCEDMNQLIPMPQEFLYKGTEVALDGNWDILVDIFDENDFFAAMELRKELRKTHNLSLAVKAINNNLSSENNHIMLVNLRKNEKTIPFCLNKGIYFDKTLPEEGYILEVFSDSIIIAAGSGSGVFYGAQSLKQLIKSEEDLVVVPEVKIKDWPDSKIRGVHLCGIGLSDMYDVINKIAALKMNTAIIERDFWYDFRLKKINDLVNYEKFFDYCRERHINPVPNIHNFGISSFVLKEDPHCAEGIWVQDEKFEFVDNMARPIIALDVEIKNPGFEKNGGQNVPEGWEFRTDLLNSINYWLWDDSVAHTGTYSAKVSLDSQGSSNSLLQKCQVTPRAAYSLTFYAKRSPDGSQGYPIAMRISQRDKYNRPIVKNYYPVKSKRWQKHIFNFITEPDCVSIHIIPSIVSGKGAAWFDDLELKRMNGSLINVIQTETSNIIITNLDKTKIYIEGIDYKVEDGDMRYWDIDEGDAYPYDFRYRAPTKIKRLPNGRIKEKEKVLLNYNFVLQLNPCYWKSTYCPGEPRTYEIVFQAIRGLMESALNIDAIVIGDSEVFGMNRDSRSLKEGKSNAELLSYDINKICNFIYSLKPNMKIFLYDDMLNPHHFGGQKLLQMIYGGRMKGGTAEAIKSIPKNVVPIVWWYKGDDELHKMKKSPSYFKANGFDYMVATAYDKENIHKWADIISKRKDCLGVINTNWPNTPPEYKWGGLKLTAGYSWNYKSRSYTK